MISPRPSLSSGFFSRSASFSRPASFSPSPPPSPLPQAPPLLSAPAPFSRAASFSRSASGTAVAAPDHASCFYDVLGLQAGASYEEIKAAYRRLARAVHPDVAPHASADDFIRVQAAYSTLSDPSKRADYDRRVVVPSAVGRRRAPSLARSPSFPGFRRRTWETDQCW
ncbi:chaperone protein dnaJ 11, chloroplastic [Brachypodium distachyon]|uniref:chaperone protein dnaJ 11, chloroplastic n=1 Tax=Brachypodium distachyon TaxID=15368 RepID=UPI000234EB81|nr:chaperone protein dnaJ 11, chloroplastic [Brachypodium distachyon]|eukprot:XP_010228886.1 chaperone protein dnaJ 11, chloroplastic [Brachypodium distachyon]